MEFGLARLRVAGAVYTSDQDIDRWSINPSVVAELEHAVASAWTSLSSESQTNGRTTITVRRKTQVPLGTDIERVFIQVDPLQRAEAVPFKEPWHIVLCILLVYA